MKTLITVLLISFSVLAQPNFTAYPGNPVLAKGTAGEWDVNIVFWPIVSVVNDTFYLTYLGNDNHPTNPVKIGLATSIDGFNYTKSNSNPILSGDGSGFDAYQTDGGPLHYKDGTWELYYAGQSSPPSQVGKVIGKATAGNPHGPWNRTNDTLLTVGSAGEWDSEFITPISIVENNSELYLYYFGGNFWPNGVHEIGLAISADGGFTWAKYNDPSTSTAPYFESDPVLSPGPQDLSIWGGSIIKRNSAWELYYSGFNGGQHNIRYAISDNGINWVKPANNTIMEPSQDPLAITNVLEQPSIVLMDTNYYMYYDYGISPIGIGLTTDLHTPGIIKVPDDYPTIQSGIEAAFDGDTVLVANGTYYENINFIGKALTVASYFIIDNDTSHISATIIDGSQPTNPDSGSVVYFVSGEDTTSVLCGFTVTGGTGTNDPLPIRHAGGINCYLSGAKIINNYIQANSLDSPNIMVIGSAISAGPPWNDSTIVIKNNKIQNNYINGGHQSIGAINVTCNAIITNNIVKNNLSESSTGSCGEGIVFNSIGNSPKYAFASDNVIKYNQALSTANSIDGGLSAGIAVANHFGTIKNNIIQYNYVSAVNRCYAPGLLLELTDTTLTVFNNIISNNGFLNGECWGGGICVYLGSAKIINNTIAYNNASYGGGLYFFNSSAIAENMIIWDNNAPTGEGIYLNNSTIDLTFSDIQGGWTGTGNIDTDPIFIDTLFHLDPNSPCIDNGNPALTDPVDPNNPGYALWPAMGGLQSDMGAYGGPGSKEITTGIENLNNGNVPQLIYLKQNYPNPFNPTTTIEFSIPKPEFATLKIYNILGQEVATLVADKLTPGNYKYIWNATGFASGIYYYKLSAHNGFVETRKLILMK